MKLDLIAQNKSLNITFFVILRSSIIQMVPVIFFKSFLDYRQDTYGSTLDPLYSHLDHVYLK